jgi:predicted RNA-binding Zn ribbon-like protein
MSTLLDPRTHAVGDHGHDADLDTCLALVNTVELTDGLPSEGLPTASEALAWLLEHGLGHPEVLGEQATQDGDAWLARIHSVRAAIRATWDAVVDGRAPDPDALALLNETLLAAPAPELRSDGTVVMVGHRHREDDPTGEALARLVGSLAAAIAAGETGRFRVCANDGCRWVFEDTSRSGRRRWCDMTTCGNRAKVRRFRTRHRSAGPEDPDGPADPGWPQDAEG